MRLPLPSGARRPLLTAALGVAAAVALAVAAWTWWPAQQEGDPPAQPWAVLVESTADVLVEGPVEPPAAGPFSLSGNPTIRTQADDGLAVVQYADGTRLELFGNSAIRLEQRPAEGKRVRLLEGSLRANVQRQPPGLPLIVQTPHTELRVLGTRFGVTALPDEGTRVHLESGQVELTRGQEAPTKLEPGTTAFVPAEAAPVVIQDRSGFLNEPDREVTFAGLRGLVFAPDGQTVVGHTSRQAVYWQPSADRLETAPLGGEVRKSYDIPVWNESVLALVQASQQHLMLWNLARRQAHFSGPNPEPRLTLAAVSPRGDWWAYWTAAKTGVRLRRPDQAEPVEVNYPGKLSCIAASADGKLLAVGRLDGKDYVADVLDAGTGRLVARLPVDLPGRRKVPLSLSFSADGRRLAVALVGRIQVYDVPAQQRLAVIEHPAIAIRRLALAPDGQSIAATAQDDWVWVWRVARPGEPLGIHVARSARGLAFAPNGQALAVLDHTSRITLWNLPRQ